MKIMERIQDRIKRYCQPVNGDWAELGFTESKNSKAELIAIGLFVDFVGLFIREDNK